MRSRCYKCATYVTHLHHDDGSTNLRDAHLWQRGGPFAPPEFYTEEDGYR
jgi:hypothetical protein